MSKNFLEVKERLIEMRAKWKDRGDFNEHTAGDVINFSEKAKPLIVEHGDYPEVIAAFNNAIELAKAVSFRNGKLDFNAVANALKRFEYGVALFLNEV